VITILYGTDRLSIDERVAATRTGVDPSGISTTIIDDASNALPTVQAACGAIGFFGSGRLVVARDLLSSGARRGRKSKSNPETDSAIDILAHVPPETTLLVVERSLDGVTERSLRRAVKDLTVERLDVPRGQQLIEWTSARARRHDAVIGQTESRQLLEALFPGSWPAESRRDDVPPDLYRLDSEIAKLAIAAGSGGTISKEQIVGLVPGAEAEDFWGITNAIMSGDAGKAVIEVERAYSQGSAPEAILGQLTSQFEVLAVASLADRTTSLADLSSISGLSEGRLRQSTRYSNAFPASRIGEALNALRDLDADAKQGLIEISDSLVPLVASLATTSSRR
jgi:DNA polymerase-3 subunit delta